MKNRPLQHAPADDAATDLEWLAAVAAGERGALEKLYARHAPRLAGFLARHARQKESVEEIVNETFWIVWRNARTFRGDSRVGTWIVGIACRCLANAARTPQPEPLDAASVDDCIEASHNENELRELRDWIDRGLHMLPADQRMTIELAYFLGLSCEEIAEVSGVAVGTVKARMFHARVRLRTSLPRLGGDETQARRYGERP